MDQKRGRLIALREIPGHPESKNTICAIDLKSGAVTDLVSGADFYNCARVSGDRMLWISWNHPNMPWNGTELWVGDLTDLSDARKIAGDREHAISQAHWGPDGKIDFAAELDNYMKLYRYGAGQLTAVFDQEAEFTLPDWNPGRGQVITV